MGRIFRRVSSSVIWARVFNLGYGLECPCQEAEMLVGPPCQGKPFLLCHVPCLGLMLHWLCRNPMPHNIGTPPLAWQRLCDSRGLPKPVNTAPGTMRHMRMATMAPISVSAPSQDRVLSLGSGLRLPCIKSWFCPLLAV